jgi:hypothetical protein
MFCSARPILSPNEPDFHRAVQQNKTGIAAVRGAGMRRIAGPDEDLAATRRTARAIDSMPVDAPF